MAKTSQEASALAEKISKGFLKDILIDGKVNERGVILQIVYLEMNDKFVEMELSDTIYKTRRILLSFSRPQKFKLYMILNVLYDVKPIRDGKTFERFNFIVKKFKAPIEEIDIMLGNPEYFGISVDNVKQEVFDGNNESTSSILSEPAKSTVELIEMGKTSQGVSAFAEKIPKGFLKDILIDGKVNERGVILQIVYLDMGDELVEMELSDTIYKTRKILMSFSRPQKFKLYMTVNVLYDVQPIEDEDTIERYIFMVKKIKAPKEEIGMILGNPKYLEESVDIVKQEVSEGERESTSTTSIGPTTSRVLESSLSIPSTSLDSLTVEEVEEALLLNISDEIVASPSTLLNNLTVGGEEERALPLNNSDETVGLSSTSLNNLTVEEEEEEEALLLNISDEIVGLSPEKIRENDRNSELLKYIKRDLTDFENEKLGLMKENQSILNQFQFFQKKEKEIDNRIATAKNELFAIDAELEDIEKSISELEAKKKLLL